MEEAGKTVKAYNGKKKVHGNRLPREALDARATEDEMETLKDLRRSKGVIAHIAVLNDPITELAIELGVLFQAQRRIKGDPLGQRNVAKYKKAVEASKIALAAIKEVGA